MANKINIGAKLSLDGEKEYKQSLKEITSEQKLLTSEMKLASAQYDDNANSLEALERKNVILTKQIDNQTDKVKLYTKAVDESSEKQKKSSDQIEKYASELNKAEKEMDDMKKSSKATTEELDKQEKTVAELQKKLLLSESAYNKSVTATNSYKTSLNTAEAQLTKLNTELNQNETYLKEASQSATKTATSIDNMGNKMSMAKKETSDFGNILKANLSGAAIIGGITALAYAVENVSTKMIDLGVSAAAYADDMLTMSTVTGISTDKLQAYNYMAELTDTSMETIEKTMVKNIKSMTAASQGTATYVDAYNKLGVSVTDANGKLLDSETVYWQLIDALGQVANETERDSLSMTIFGKSAQDLNTLIAQGSKGVAGFTDEARKMGAVLDNDTLKKLAETDDAVQRFTQSTEILKRKIGAELSDELTQSMEKIGDAMEESGDQITDLAEGGIELLADGLTWLIDNSDVVIAGLAGIGGAMITGKIVEGVIAGVEAYKTLSTAIKSAAASQEILNLVQAASPIGLLVTAIAGVTAGIVAYNLVSEDAVSKTDAYIEKTKEVSTSLADGVTKRNENISSMNSEIGFMKTLETELVGLNEKESLSVAEKGRMNEIVTKLNSSMPSLNLAIDENTGKLIGNTDAIQESIDKNLEWYKVQAAKEELTALMEEQAKAELEIYKIDQKLADNTEINTILEEKRMALYTDSTKVLDDYDEELALMTHNILENNKETEKLNEQKTALTETEEGLAGQSEVLNGYIKESTAVTEENGEAVAKQQELYTVYGEVIQGVSTANAEAIGVLNQAFTDAKTSAENSLMSQVGLFEAAAESSSLSIGEMTANLQTQTEAFNQYKDDILAASSLVEQGLMSEGLLGYIESFGIEGAGSLHTLVTAAQTDKGSFEAMMGEWGEMQTAKDGLSSSMAEIETNYSDGMEALGIVVDDGSEDVTKTVDTMNKSVEKSSDVATKKTVANYSKMMDGIDTAISAKAPQIATTSAGVANAVVEGTAMALGIVGDSSTRGASLGHAFGNGIANGITASQSKITKAIQTTLDNGIAKASFSKLNARIDKALGDALNK